MLKFISVILFFIIPAVVISQYQNVRISNLNGPEEVTICINPKNPNMIVAGSNTYPTSSCGGIYYSTNGGYNWAAQYLLASSNYGVWGDFCIITDTNGYFYCFHLANPPSPGNWIDRIVCQKSTNNGVSFNNPGSYTYMSATKQEDKEWAVIDPRNNYIYVTWTEFDNYGSTTGTDSSRILFSKSTNGGTTWVTFPNGQTAKQLNKVGGDCWDSDNTVEGAVPAVGPNGEVYVAWAGPKVRNSQYGIYFTKSTDGGTTFYSTPTYVCDQTGGWDYIIDGIYRANGLPATYCDLSNGPYRGNIYINFTDSISTTDHDVKLVKSTNGGLNWSTPIRVNNDAAGKEQFFSWMAVDQKTGHLYIVFYDRRNYTNTYTDVYLARSTDGGTSFSNIKIDSTYFNPTSGTFFGDYNGISAYNGVVRPIWTRLDGMNLSIWTAIVNFPVAVEQIGTNVPDKFTLEQNYPNPFNPSTKIRFTIPNLSVIARSEATRQSPEVTLKVFDILGKEVQTLVNEKMNTGTYEYEFNAGNLTSGTYFYRLTAGTYIETKKMLIIK